MSRWKWYKNTEEILSKLIYADPTSGCWIWLGSILQRTGYGRIKISGQDHRAHRWVYEVLRAPVPDGLLLRHTCDIRCRVNPNHLIPGTAADNINDAKIRGRMAAGDRHGARTHPERLRRGLAHGRARLTVEQNSLAEQMLRSGRTAASVAREFGLDIGVILRVRHRSPELESIYTAGRVRE